MLCILNSVCSFILHISRIECRILNNTHITCEFHFSFCYNASSEKGAIISFERFLITIWNASNLCCMGRVKQTRSTHTEFALSLSYVISSAVMNISHYIGFLRYASTGCPSLSMKDNLALLACLFFHSNQSEASWVQPTREVKRQRKQKLRSVPPGNM
jgi:hypothetical protein